MRVRAASRETTSAGGSLGPAGSRSLYDPIFLDLEHLPCRIDFASVSTAPTPTTTFGATGQTWWIHYTLAPSPGRRQRVRHSPRHPLP